MNIRMASLVVVVSLLSLTTVSGVSPPLPGGKVEIDVKEVPVKVVCAGAKHLLNQNDSPCASSLTLESVTRQVVEGLKYELTYKADLALCDENQSGTKQCTVLIWVKPGVKGAVIGSEPKCVKV